MYSVMGGVPVGCSPRIKGGVPGRAIVKILHFCIKYIMAVEGRFGGVAFFFFSSALCEPYPTQNGLYQLPSSGTGAMEEQAGPNGGQRKVFFVSEHT